METFSRNILWEEMRWECVESPLRNKRITLKCVTNIYGFVCTNLENVGNTSEVV
jgi:hypothetical protein